MNVLEEVSYEDLLFAESIDCIRESAYMYDDSEEAEEDDDDDGDDGRLVKDQEAPENEPSEEGEIEECSESPNQTEVCQFKHSSESDGSNETDHKKRSMDAATPPLNQACLHPQSTFGADINNGKSGKDSNNSTWKVQGSSGLELGAANDSIKQTQAMGENHLTQLFSPFGKVTKVKLLRDLSTGISKGSAFVYFENPDDTTLAVKNMNGRLINGHMLAVTEALPMPPRTLSSSASMHHI